MPTGWVSPQGLARPRVGWRPNVTPEFLHPFNSWSVCMRGGACWEVEGLGPVLSKACRLGGAPATQIQRSLQRPHCRVLPPNLGRGVTGLFDDRCL